MDIEWSGFHDLDESNIKKFAPTTGGIYTLWWLITTTNTWRCFYVGQAEDIEKRLIDHIGINEPNFCIKHTIKNYQTRFYCARLAGIYRDGVEKYLIENYRTLVEDKTGSCNKNKPDARLIPVNLPNKQ